MFSVADPRKGAAYLLEATGKLAPELRPWLLVVGNKLATIPAGCEARQVGYVSSDDVLNLCYGAADVFVLPTLAENAPLSLLDARAAGTPTVAFDVGGVPDLVRHLETGYLVTERSAEGLAEGMRRLLTDPELRRRLGQNARRTAEREDANELYSSRYLALYDEVISVNPRSSQRRA
jgi:glycosyltransferase involved in cell wall biosynthesis